MVTIADVAAKAGVSRATVSYVLNARSTSVRISDDTRQRVMESAMELGYRRNELARAMTTGKNRMLGFWVMQSNREPVVRVLSGAMREADDNDYFIKMIGFDNGALDSRILERCVEWRLSGIMAIHAPETILSGLFPRIQETGIPFVAVDSQMTPTHCDHIEADHGGGMRAAVEHLLGLGHTRIAFLGGQNSARDSISRVREAAYLQTMRAHGLGQQTRVAFGDWCADFKNWQNGATAQAARTLLQATPRPTAITCASDHIAMIVIRLAGEMGLRVPEDLSVTGFDDVTVATLYNPALTTVSQPFEELGRAAVRHLLGLEAPRALSLPARLIVRASTARPLLA